MRRAQNITFEKYTCPELFFFFFSFALQFRRSTMICWDHMFTIPELGLLYPNKTSTGPQISWMVNFFCSFCSFFHFLQDIAYLNFPWNPPLHLYCSFFFNLGGSPLCDQWKGLCWVPTLNEPTLPSPYYLLKSNEKTCCCSSSSSQNTAQTIIEEALFQSVCCLVSIICCFNK
jgi:hypothetical protein